MTRNGKIARLPRGIRDEVNRRLDDGEQGIKIVEWLNSLPEVKEVMDACFSGNPISEVNLTKWKQGGFLEWKTHQETVAGLAKLKADGEELADVAASVADDLEALVLARYAATVHGATGEISAATESLLKCMSKSLRDLVRYRRCRQGAERTEIQRETLDLKRQKTEEGQRKKFMELARNPKIQEKLTPKMTPEEKAAAISKILFPNGL